MTMARLERLEGLSQPTPATLSAPWARLGPCSALPEGHQHRRHAMIATETFCQPWRSGV